MTILDLGKLRFHMAGEYVPDKMYEVNDVVKYGGNAYVYTFALKQSGVLPTATTHWAVLVEGIKFRGDFNPDEHYKVSEVVVYGAHVYLAIQDSMGVAPPNTTFWELLAPGLRHRGNHAADTLYYPDDIVSVGGSLYVCPIYHASTNFDADFALGRWQKFVGGTRWRHYWAAGTDYLADDIFRYGSSTYRATAAHTAGSSFAADLAAGHLELMAQGADFPNPDPAPAPSGASVVVRNGVYVLEDISIKTLVVSANANLVRNTIYALDSTAGSFNLTLPPAPGAGDTVRLFDAGSNLSGFPVTVQRNGALINRHDDDLLLDVSEASLSLAYINPTIGWKVY